MPIQICLTRLACFPKNIQADDTPDDTLFPSRGADFTLGDWAEELRQAGPRAWIVVPTARRRRALQQPLADAGEGARLLPRILALNALPTYLGGFCATQKRLIGAAEQAVRLSQALAQNGHHASTGLVSHALKVWQQQFTQAGRAEEFGDAPPRQPLQNALATYRQALDDDGVWDSCVATDSLIEELDQGNSPLSQWLEQTVPVILFDGFHHFDSQTARLVEKLGLVTEVRLWIPALPAQPWHADVERLLQQLMLPAGRTLHDATLPISPLRDLAARLSGEAPGDQPVPCPEHAARLVLVAQRKDEPRWVTGEIRRLLRSEPHLAAHPERIGLVVPNTTEATRYRLACDRADIPCSAQAEVIPLAGSRVSRLAQAALGALDQKFSHEEIFTLLGSRLFTFSLEGAFRLHQLRKLGLGVRRARTPAEWLTYWKGAIERDRLPRRDEGEPDAAETARRQETADNLLLLAGRVRDRLDSLVACFDQLAPDQNPGPALVARLARFLTTLNPAVLLGGEGRPESLPAREVEEDQLAWNNLLDVLAGLAHIPDNRFPTTLGTMDLATALRSALESEQFRLRAHDTAAVQIILPEALRGADFDRLIWVGLQQDSFPPRVRRDEQLDPGEADRLEREPLLYLTQGLLATRQVVFVRSGQDGEERLQPSPYWDRLSQALGIANAPPTVAAPGDEREGLSPVAAPRGEEEGLWQALAQTSSAAVDADIIAWVERQAAMETLPDGKKQLSNGPFLEPWAVPLLQAVWNTARYFTPTGLERFVGCPFRFFAEQTLGLRQEDENRLGMNWGNLVHQGMQNLLTPGTLFPTEWQNLTGCLETAQVNYEEYLDPFHSHQAARIAPLLQEAQYINLLQGYSVIGTEVTFREEVTYSVAADPGVVDTLATDPAITDTFIMMGRIDLVLGRDDNNHPQRVVVDHKTGKLTSIKQKVHAQRLLQPLIYGWAQQRQGDGKIERVGAAYLLLQHKEVILRGSSNLIDPAGRAIDGRSKPFPMTLTTIENTMAGMVRRIRAGDISLTPYGPDHDKPECTYCPLRRGCRHPLNG